MAGCIRASFVVVVVVVIVVAVVVVVVVVFTLHQPNIYSFMLKVLYHNIALPTPVMTLSFQSASESSSPWS